MYSSLQQLTCTSWRILFLYYTGDGWFGRDCRLLASFSFHSLCFLFLDTRNKPSGWYRQQRCLFTLSGGLLGRFFVRWRLQFFIVRAWGIKFLCWFTVLLIKTSVTSSPVRSECSQNSKKERKKRAAYWSCNSQQCLYSDIFRGISISF